MSLSGFGGRWVDIKLITDVGPDDNSYSDWALWGAPRVLMDETVMRLEILSEEPPPQFAPPSVSNEDITAADLTGIEAARITLDTAGVDGGDYTPYLYLNGICVGAVPPSVSETEWLPVEVAVPEEALRSIRRHNAAVIKNPGRDFMKVRRLCLQFQLEDGRRGASYVDLGPYTSAQGWPHAEGQSVPLGHDLPAANLDIPLETAQ